MAEPTRRPPARGARLWFAIGLPLILAGVAIPIGWSQNQMMLAVGVAGAALAAGIPGAGGGVRGGRQVSAVRPGGGALGGGGLGRPPLSEDAGALGDLGVDLEHTRKALRRQMSGMQTQLEEQARLINDLGQKVSDFVGGREQLAAAIEETAASMHEMTASLKGIAENVETLAGAAEESSSSILEMAAANDEDIENMMNLASSGQESAT